MGLSNENIFKAKQKLQTLSLKSRHLTAYIDQMQELDDHIIDDPYFNDLVMDIKELHKELTP